MKTFNKYIFNNRYFSTFILLIMLITPVGALLTGCSTDDKVVLTTGFGNEEIMRIGDLDCSTQEALLYLSDTKKEYAKLYGADIWSVSINGVYVKDNIKTMVLNQIIKTKVMNLMAADMGIALDEDSIKGAKVLARDYYEALSDDDKAKLGNITQEKLEEIYQEKILAGLLYQELTNDINQEISDDEARTIVLKQIYVSYGQNDTDKVDARTKCEEAVAQFGEGVPFEKLIGQYSEKEEESLYYQKGDLPESMEISAFNLGQGEISDIIEGNDGYYILYCVNPNDLSVTESTKAEIIENRKREAFDEKYEAFNKTVSYYINMELWDSIDYEIK